MSNIPSQYEAQHKKQIPTVVNCLRPESDACRGLDVVCATIAAFAALGLNPAGAVTGEKVRADAARNKLQDVAAISSAFLS